jgi:hypothetical protein
LSVGGTIQSGADAMTKLFKAIEITTAVLFVLAILMTVASAEGLASTPGGCRAAPCCREYGFPGYRGRPPLEFIFGALAPSLAASLARPPIAVPPPYPPPPYGAIQGEAMSPPRPYPPLARAPTPPPSGNALNVIEDNPRGITRAEVEAAIADWCASHGEAPLCQKLQR